MSTELAFHDQKLYKVFAREKGTKQGLLILTTLHTGQLSHLLYQIGLLHHTQNPHLQFRCHCLNFHHLPIITTKTVNIS